MTHFGILCGYQLDKESNPLLRYIGFACNQKCSQCSKHVPRVYNYTNTTDNKKLASLCELCNNMYKYNTSHLKYGMLCSSKLTQMDIIHKTHEHFAKYKQMPNITDIDIDAKQFDTSTYHIVKAMLNFQNDGLFKDVKFFATDKINIDNLTCAKLGGSSKIRRYADFGFFVKNILDKCELSADQIKIIDHMNV